jgi:C4-dicarboxylate transporter/malic acid transport protein
VTKRLTKGTNFMSSLLSSSREESYPRLRHFTWAWFTLPMSTGGIAVLLSETPHRFQGLDTIGLVFFILDLLIFSGLCATMITRFILCKGTFVRSLHHPTESLFIPTFLLASGIIIIDMRQYAHVGDWMITVLRVLFWIYFAMSFFLAVIQYVILFTGKPHTIQSMTPAWILPAFPIMLAGPIASSVVGLQNTEHGIPIIIAGVMAQGLGFIISLLMYANYIGRLMSYGLPDRNARPGMFIAVGPPAFTGLALIGLSEEAVRLFPSGFVSTSINVPEVLRVMALFSGIFVWFVAFWFFSISFVATILGIREGISFHLTWWALIFPNVGLTLDTIAIGSSINSVAIGWVCSAMTIMLVATWIFVLSFHVEAVWSKKIMGPGKNDEDNEEDLA